MKTSLFSLHRWTALLALLVSACLVAAPALADPSGRIGRIALLSGTVNLYNPNTGDSFSAPLNQPLTSGDILSTGPHSRTEIQIGSMTVRLDSGSRLELDRIDDEQVHLYLRDGRAIVKLPSPEAVSDFALETRYGRFSARHAGIYRIDAEANSASGTAYAGTLHFASSDSALDIAAGSRAEFWQDGQSPGQTRYRLSTIAGDEFAQWSAARDQRPTSNTYSRYVSPEMTGAEDLDAYGNWSENAEYGAIWYPRNIAADWAPYRSGHWAWVAPWGWTWVGQEAWGFAPFHYGRWVHHHGMWGWVPGTRIARPVYAPAMVAWIGTPGIGVSIGFRTAPAVGWFPLAPREVYVPAYRSSANHVRNVNITHVTRISNVTNIINNPQVVVQQTHYAHRVLPQAVTVVPADALTQRRSITPAALSAREQRTLREQPVQATAPVAAPQASTRAEIRGRQEHSGQAFGRREREPAVPFVNTPTLPENRGVSSPQSTPAAPAPVVTNQRNERAMPEITRQPPPGRPEQPVAVRRQEVVAPLALPPATQQSETRNHQERSGQPFIRSEREQQPALVATPPPGNRGVMPTAPVPQALVVVPQRMERPVPEAVRPVPPQARSEPIEARVQERPVQREVRVETAAQRIERPAPEVIRPVPQARPEPLEVRVQERPVQRDVRVETAPQRIVQAPLARVEVPLPVARETRHEAPREISRPAEARPETRPQRQEEPRRANDQEKQRHRREASEKR